MKISFQSISGHTVTGSFQKADTIRSACNFLSSTLKVPPQLIRIRNPKDFTFLGDNLKIVDSVDLKDNTKNSAFLIYFILPPIPKYIGNEEEPICLTKEDNKKNTNDKICNYAYDEELLHRKNLILPSESIVKIFDSIEKHPSHRTHLIYKIYARSLNLPSDFEEKVESLHQMGFEIEESKEALRASEFNVQAAVNRLINNQNNRHDTEDEIHEGNIRIFDLFHVLSMMRDDDGNVDPDRIGQIIRLFSNRHRDHNDDDHNADDQNENNGDDRRHGIRYFILNRNNNHDSDNDDDNGEESSESNSIDNQDLSDAMSELSDKLDYIDLSSIFDTFSHLIDESRELIARSKDEQIIEFITFLNSYIDDNGRLPRFFQRKMNSLSDYFDNENNPDIDYLISLLQKVTEHDYDNDNDDSDDIDNSDNDETGEEEEDIEVDFSSDGNEAINDL